MIKEIPNDGLGRDGGISISSKLKVGLLMYKERRVMRNDAIKN